MQSKEQKKDEVTLKPGFRDQVKNGTKYPLENGRYHLYISYACPLCHGILIIRNLLGLEDAIGLSVTHPLSQKTRENEDHWGWAFGEGPYTNKKGNQSYKFDDTISDPYLQAQFLRDIYEKCNNAKKEINSYSIPVLYDTKTQDIVNSSSSDLYDMLISNFLPLAKNKTLDLNPKDLQEKRKEIETKVFDNVIKRVYECGYSQIQEDYDKHVEILFNQLDEFEELLGKQRYLLGKQLTIPDIRLFCSLVRFDEAYAKVFRCNKKFIAQYPSLLNFCRDIYQYGNVKDTVFMEHVRVNYHNMDVNPSGIISPKTNFEQLLKEPHNRAKL